MIDMIATSVAGLLVICAFMPTAARIRELGKRSVCSINLASIGVSAKIYASDNDGRWMIPAFSEIAYEHGGNGIDYLNDDGNYGSGIGATDPGEVGWRRRDPTTPMDSYYSGSTAGSTTRAYWLLVRSGDANVQQFICPSSEDKPDLPSNIDLYYDFASYTTVSYGYQVPFGPPDTQPREGADNRIIFASDKGPYYLAGADPTNGFFTNGPGGHPLTIYDPPRYWRPFNSSNHGGRGNGEGQNCLYADGAVSFERTPTVGIDHDNIYTLMLDEWDATGWNLIYGDSPQVSAQHNPYPGVDALGPGPEDYSSTDSLIYP